MKTNFRFKYLSLIMIGILYFNPYMMKPMKKSAKIEDYEDEKKDNKFSKISAFSSGFLSSKFLYFTLRKRLLKV